VRQMRQEVCSIFFD